MSTTALNVDFGSLQAPAENGAVLVAPAPAAMRAAVETTPAAVADWRAPIADLDLRDVRREVRRRVAGVGDESRVVVTGHQPEFIHAGVWAKHVVASRLAEAAGGVALNLVVDTDAPKSTSLAVPVMLNGVLHRDSLPGVEVPVGAPYECIARLDETAVSRLASVARQRLGERFERSMLGPYFEAFGQAEQAQDFVDQTVTARTAVERIFGVAMLERRVSRCWLCPLLVEILGQPGRFFACYNEALAAYRRERGIRGAQRPVPDLIADGDRLELPLWVMRDSQPRSRLFVEERGDALHVYAGQSRLGAVPLAVLRQWDSAREALGGLGEVRFRPRALTLTLWARLLLADLFVHGIGGAKYDRITDLLMARYFGVEPPPMACVSATLRLDLPRKDATPAALRDLRHRLRDLRFNPQRHLADGPEFTRLAEERGRAVARSQELRAAGSGSRAQRRATFDQIRALTRNLLDLEPGATRAAEEDVRRIESALRENRVADDREFFFALFDEPTLRRLCGALPAVEQFRV